MQALPKYRDRDDTEVAVIDALADRREEGMTVFELRSRVDVDIDTLEQALSELKDDGLIEATEEQNRTVIRPAEGVIGSVDTEEHNVLDDIRDRLPF